MAVLKLLCGALGLAVLLPLWPVLENFEDFRPLVLEPAGLGAAMRALPERRLSREEQETVRRDGCLLVRGVVNDTRILKELLAAMQEHENPLSAEYQRPQNYNGPVRALLREGPLGALLADAMQAEGASLWGAPIWGAPGQERLISGAWHQDSAANPELMTLWLAVTRAPHALDFLRGSHRNSAEIFAKCNASHRMGKPGERILEHHCVMELAKERLEPEVGEPAYAWADLEPGDAWLFSGHAVHRGLLWPRERLAMAVRVVPGHGSLGGIHPRRETNLASARDVLLPRPQRLWPHLPDVLPPGNSGPEKALRWTVAMVTQAAFGRSHSLRAALSWLKQKVLTWKAGSTPGR